MQNFPVIYYPMPYFVQEFTPLLLQPPQHQEQATNVHNRKSSESLSQTAHAQPMLVIGKEDLLKAGYETNKRPWTQEEDQILLKCKEEKDMEWGAIAKMLPSRNPKMCYSRYKRLLDCTKVGWREKDELKLQKLVAQYGEDWKTIEQHFKRWNARQIKDHYDYHLRSNLDGKDWDIEDDLRLVAFVNAHGKNWAASQEYFPHKSMAHVKNRYYGRIRKVNEAKLARMEQEDEEWKQCYR